MESEIQSKEELGVQCEDDIVIVRQRVKVLSVKQGFDTFAAAALTTAASELSRNIWTHAGNGIVTLELLENGDRAGIRMRFEDHGPGIPDLPRVLAGGYSTTKTLGLGLSGSRRLVDEFQIDSNPGHGTTVTVTKWNPR